MRKQRLSNRRRNKRRRPWFVEDEANVCTRYRTDSGWRWLRAPASEEWSGFASYSDHRTRRSAMRAVRRIAELGGRPAVTQLYDRREVYGKTWAWAWAEEAMARAR